MKKKWSLIVFLMCIFQILLPRVNFSNSLILQEKHSKRNNISTGRDTVLILSDTIKAYISNYISSIDGNFFDKEWLYYNLFFFEKNNLQYFTIWTFTCFPSYISDCISREYRYYLTFFEGRKVVLIEKKTKANLFFKPSKKSNSLAKREDRRTYEGVIYDGPFYFQTFQFREDNNVVLLIKLDSAFTDFINCQELMIIEE
jgi:hypothetical protein